MSLIERLRGEKPFEGTELREAAAQLEAMQAEIEATRAKYEELIYAVSIKHPQEDRHETALRYIRQAEQGSLTTQEKSNG